MIIAAIALLLQFLHFAFLDHLLVLSFTEWISFTLRWWFMDWFFWIFRYFCHNLCARGASLDALTLWCSFHECLVNEGNRYAATFKAVILIFLGHSHNNDRHVEPIVENTLDLFINVFVQKDCRVRCFVKNGATTILKERDNVLGSILNWTAKLLIVDEWILAYWYLRISVSRV